MLNPELGVGEQSLEPDPLADLRRLQEARPASILTDGSALRWRFGERLDDVLEEACRRFADRIAVSDRRGGTQLPRPRRAREPDGAVLPRPRRQARRPGRRAARPRRRGLCDAVRAAQGGGGLCPARSEPSGRPASATSSRTRARRLVVAHLRLADKLAGAGVETLVLDAARETIAGFDDAPLDRSREGRARRRPLLRALHLGHDRQSQGRRDRPSEHLQFRPRRRRDLRLRPRRPRLSGHVDRLRLLDRGGVGSAGRRRDAGPEHAGDEPVRRGARRFPRGPRDHLLRLRADAARLDRSRSAEAARLPDRRRGLPAGAGQALEPAGPHAAQQLRADRDDRHRDARRPDARQAGDHRQAAADLFDRHPRPRGGRRGRVRRAGRDRHRRRRRRRGLSQPARADRARSSSRTSSPCRTTAPAASIAPATSAA